MSERGRDQRPTSKAIPPLGDPRPNIKKDQSEKTRLTVEFLTLASFIPFLFSALGGLLPSFPLKTNLHLDQGLAVVLVSSP